MENNVALTIETTAFVFSLELDLAWLLELFAELLLLIELEDFGMLLELDFALLELDFTTELELLSGSFVYMAVIVIFAVTGITSPTTPSMVFPL